MGLDQTGATFPWPRRITCSSGTYCGTITRHTITKGTTMSHLVFDARPQSRRALLA